VTECQGQREKRVLLDHVVHLGIPKLVPQGQGDRLDQKEMLGETDFQVSVHYPCVSYSSDQGVLTMFVYWPETKQTFKAPWY